MGVAARRWRLCAGGCSDGSNRTSLKAWAGAVTVKGLKQRTEESVRKGCCTGLSLMKEGWRTASLQAGRSSIHYQRGLPAGLTPPGGRCVGNVEYGSIHLLPHLAM